jgi:hypothetical protein
MPRCIRARQLGSAAKQILKAEQPVRLREVETPLLAPTLQGTRVNSDGLGQPLGGHAEVLAQRLKLLVGQA